MELNIIPTSSSSFFVSGSMVTFDHKCSNIEDSEFDPLLIWTTLKPSKKKFNFSTKSVSVTKTNWEMFELNKFCKDTFVIYGVHVKPSVEAQISKVVQHIG